MAEKVAFELSESAKNEHGIEGVDGSFSLDGEGGTFRIGEALRKGEGVIVTDHQVVIAGLSGDPNFKRTSLPEAETSRKGSKGGDR